MARKKKKKKARKQWVIWCGHGIPPADMMSKVDVEFRDGTKVKGNVVGALRWAHIGKPCDIILYRKR